MMKPTGTGPTIGTGKNGFIAKFGPHPFQFISDEFQRDIIVNFNESLFTPAMAGLPWPVFQIAFAYGGLLNPGATVDSGGNIFIYTGWIRVLRMRDDTFKPVVIDNGKPGTPMM